MPEIKYQLTLEDIEKLLDDVARDVCPSCQLLIDWRDYYTKDDIKTKILEVTNATA